MPLGECPRWHAREKAWYWVDIIGKSLHRYLNEQHEVKSLDFEPAFFAFTEENQIILTGHGGVYHLIDFDAVPEKLLDPARDESLRFNDGTTTPDGDFIAGTIGNGSDPVGNSYRFGFLGMGVAYDVLQRGFAIINGQCFSPDGKHYYVTDTPTQTIWRYDYNLGQLTNKTCFYTCEENEYPDGAAVDSQGNYWVAMYGTGKISVLSPEGKKLKDISLPVNQPTMVAFGGNDLDEVLVTSAAQNLSAEQLSAEPLAGSVLLLKTDVTGFYPTEIQL
jgi:sugar lactone lactonase YvrE